MLSMRWVRYFNSIKVRLKRKFPKRDKFGTIIFQFHKGTIKTSEAKRMANYVYKFQFHKGTIKTQQPVVSDLQGQYFNSIKVRLKLATELRKQLKVTINFNSIKVRLKRLTMRR